MCSNLVEAQQWALSYNENVLKKDNKFLGNIRQTRCNVEEPPKYKFLASVYHLYTMDVLEEVFIIPGETQ
jgi:hypothetical protein